jgi:hypothetical protein
VLRLTGTDTQYTNTDTLTITVLPGINSAPVVNAVKGSVRANGDKCQSARTDPFMATSS